MQREYLQVTPTSEEYATSTIPETLASLSKLTTRESPSLADQLNPFHSTSPPTFEFLAMSEGADEPVEFYYGVTDGQLDTLENRLRTIYPPTFDIARVEFDPVTKLVPPVEFSPAEFRDRVEQGQLYHDFDSEAGSKSKIIPENQDDAQKEPITEGSKNGKSTASSGNQQQNTTADGGTTTGASNEFSICADGTIEVAPSENIPDSQPLTALEQPTATETGRVLARPPTDEVSPVGVHWHGKGERKRDWMTSLTSFTDATTTAEDESDQGRAPLTPLIDALTEADQPIAFQAVFRRKPDWTSAAVDRQADLLAGRDTLGQKFIGYLLDDNWERTADDLEGDTETRYEMIEESSPGMTFTANIRALSIPDEDGAASSLESSLNSMCSALDSHDGRFYGIHGQRLQEHGIRQKAKEKNAQVELTRFLNREIATGSGETRPDLVIDGDELANFVLTPSSGDLTVEGTRSTRAEQQSRNPLPRPHQDLMREFRDGMAIGYALSGNGEAETIPTHIPPGLLPTHYGRFGTTGSGKSKALINDALSLYENTAGPVILIDPKGDGMTQNYMRTHARQFGMTDLEENVVHFPVPDVLPGFSFFNLEPSVEHGRRREDAVQRKADHYEEILKLVMGEERYEQATVAPTLIKTLIKALFDEEHGRENGLYRESADYFAHQQLEHLVDQLWDAGPPNENIEEAPRSSDEEVVRTIRRQLQLDSNTFSNVMGGVGNRLAYISQDAHLRRIFNNTENQFDFRDILDENTVILFDLGDLRDEAARILTGVILTNLDDALKERNRDLNQYSDDYVVNLLVDEAASVVVSDIMNDLLEKGRGFRLSVGLSMQFPEQMEAEGGRKVYLNALNNIGSSLVGKINVDRELAQAMAHEEMDPVDFANRIRSLPRGEWIASLPSPTFGETGPYPFSLEPLPIPPGHPESDNPLTAQEEAQFNETLSSIHEHASNESGISERTATPSTRTPAELDEVFSVDDADVDVVMAEVTRSLQLRDGVREENGWVEVEAVDDELSRLFEDVDAAPPSYDELADIRERSRFLDTTVDIDADEIMIRLTAAGAEKATPDTGSVQAAGGSDHDTALLQIEEELTTLGFTVSILSQDGSEKPDARAIHPELEQTFAIEVETTTPGKPAKVLTNLRKAQESAEVPLFIVRPGESATYWAERVHGILSPPVRELENDEVRFYTGDSYVTFNGGANEEGGATAVRPINDNEDSPQSIWQRDGDEIVLLDGTGREHVQLPDLSSLSKDRVPAVYSYDPATDEYVVHEYGERHRYESKSALEGDWSRIKRPFVPVELLPNPEYDERHYAIVILVEGEESSRVYRNGETEAISTLLETAFSLDQSGVTEANETTSLKHPDESETTQEASVPTDDAGESEQNPEQPSAEASQQWKDDPNKAVGRFVAEHISEAADGSATSATVYATYEAWAENHGLEPDAKNWFSRRLSNHVEFERTVEYRNASSIRCYEGIELREDETI